MLFLFLFLSSIFAELTQLNKSSSQCCHSCKMAKVAKLKERGQQWEEHKLLCCDSFTSLYSFVWSTFTDTELCYKQSQPPKLDVQSDISIRVIKNGCCKCHKVTHNFLLGNIEILWKLESCHINSLAIIIKRVMGGCMNSDRNNAEVWLSHR